MEFNQYSNIHQDNYQAYLVEALERIQQAVAEVGIPYEAVAEAIREDRS